MSTLTLTIWIPKKKGTDKRIEVHGTSEDINELRNFIIWKTDPCPAMSMMVKS